MDRPYLYLLTGIRGETDTDDELRINSSLLDHARSQSQGLGGTLKTGDEGQRRPLFFEAISCDSSRLVQVGINLMDQVSLTITAAW